MTKIIVTGGHFSPAHSVIQKLSSADDVIVVGRRYAFEGDNNETYEYKTCKNEGIRFVELSTGRLQRKLTAKTLSSILKFPKGIINALKILKKEQPDVVVTFGGYIGLPVCLAASTLKIPVVLHEQTLYAGLSARLIGKVASLVCVSFETSQKYFKNKKVVFTGNPLRPEIYQKQELIFKTNKPILYITGGSTGSHTINMVVQEILPVLLEKYFVVHQTGNSNNSFDFQNAIKFKEALSYKYRNDYVVSEFFSPREAAMFLQHAALVISRAGINTVSEIIVSQAVCLLIPLTVGKLHEQEDNAVFVKKIGIGQYIHQDELNGETLLNTTRDMIKEQKKYKENLSDALKYVKKDAAEKIVEMIHLYGKGSQNRGKANTPQ